MVQKICSVMGCLSSTYKLRPSDVDRRFFSFPKCVRSSSLVRFRKWIEFVGLKEMTSNAQKKGFICDLHFADTDFTNETRCKINRIAVPSLNPPNFIKRRNKNIVEVVTSFTRTGKRKGAATLVVPFKKRKCVLEERNKYSNADSSALVESICPEIEDTIDDIDDTVDSTDKRNSQTQRQTKTSSPKEQVAEEKKAAEKELAVQLLRDIETNQISSDWLECQICHPSKIFVSQSRLIIHYRRHAGLLEQERQNKFSEDEQTGKENCKIDPIREYCETAQTRKDCETILTEEPDIHFQTIECCEPIEDSDFANAKIIETVEPDVHFETIECCEPIEDSDFANAKIIETVEPDIHFETIECCEPIEDSDFANAKIIVTAEPDIHFETIECYEPIEDSDFVNAKIIDMTGCLSPEDIDEQVIEENKEGEVEVIEGHVEFEGDSETEEDGDVAEEEVDCSARIEKRISAEEGLQAFEVALKYAEEQNGSIFSTYDLIVLRRLREVAAKRCRDVLTDSCSK